MPSAASTTVIFVCRASSSGIMPLWVGSRCGTRMKAKPVSRGQAGEELLEGFQPAGRCPHADEIGSVATGAVLAGCVR